MRKNIPYSSPFLALIRVLYIKQEGSVYDSKTSLSDSLKSSFLGPVAQGIEQWFPKPCAACSNHAGATSTVNKIQLGVLRVSEIV